MMWNTKKVIVLAFCLLVGLNSSYSQWVAYGQMAWTNGTISNSTELQFMTKQNMSPEASQESPRIMENTSGMIDEVFDALKDSFKSLFGK